MIEGSLDFDTILVSLECTMMQRNRCRRIFQGTCLALKLPDVSSVALQCWVSYERAVHLREILRIHGL